MKRGKNILPNRAELDARVQGDSLGVAADWRSLEAVAEATRKRWEEDSSEEAKERYLKIIDVMLPLRGADAEGFRNRHRDLVTRLAPGSRAAMVLQGVPSLGSAPSLGNLAEELNLDLDGYQAPEADPKRGSLWIEQNEPRKAGGGPRVPAGSKAA